MKHFASDYEIDEAVARYEGLPYLAKSCNCWDGYERVPGTKPCAPGSCRKCDEGCHKKKSSQGDKPSPNAAKAVFDALTAGDENAATELLGHTDCPEGCEVHAEGKCNHQYMSAGRTRVRYLIDNQAFDKESAFGFGIAKRLLKMLVGGQCPVCEGTGKLMKVINCPACEGSGQAEVFKSKVGEFSQNQLPEIVDQFKGQIGAQAQIPDDPFALRPSAPAPSTPATSPAPFSITRPPRDDPFA